MAEKHTPTPWLVGPFDMIWPASDIEFSDGKWREKVPEPRIIASASKGNLLPNEDRANAAFIVRAVNSHDKLVEALEAAEQQLDYGQVDAAHQIILRALASLQTGEG